jgi:hypothetical protein
MSVADTDLTTPSLCSDDEGLPDDITPEEILPPTPPIRPQIIRKAQPRVEPQQVLDVDMEPSPPSKASSRRLGEILMAKRPPVSPIPAHTSRKPRPPARSPKKAPIAMPVAEDSEEDPLSLSYSPPPPSTVFLTPDPESHMRSPPSSREVSIPPSSYVSESGKSRGGSLASTSRTSQMRARRRGTLDEELQDATEESSDLENGVLMGVGTRSRKRGFLARGGAGGEPVFMGVGYVEGAEEDGMDVRDRPARRRGRRR